MRYAKETVMNRNRLWQTTLFLMMAFFTFSSLAGDYKIRKIEGAKEAFAADILQLILSKVDPAARLVPDTESMSEARLTDAVIDGQVDIIWAGTSQALEKQLLTVRIPILKGLLGHRIFIIRKADKERFKNVTELKDLFDFKAGQGTFWGDTAVLKNANIPTTTTIKYPNLFPMLEGGRFDYFPRAVHEPWVEVESRPELDLIVEEHVLLIYPYAMYFFVNPSNQILHDKLYRGFEISISDGSFDALFFANSMIKEALSKADLAKRNIIRIDNPYMHKDTPTNRSEFWLDVSKL